jgi:membrane protein DedA with SNARE-associated domain
LWQKFNTMHEIFSEITAWYMANMNYFTITLLMTIESSFIPFPSEIIVAPAAYKAAQGELNIYLVVFFSTLGALIGALFNYFLSIWIGRKLIYAFAATRIARLCLIEPKSVQKAELFFNKHGNISTFVGRLIPAVRQLISIPAGLARMPLPRFILYTTLGAFIWNVILALIGYFIPQEFVHNYYVELTYIMLGLGILFAIYIVYKAFIQKQKKENLESEPA